MGMIRAILPLLLLGVPLPRMSAAVLVVFESGIEAYGSAMEGMGVILAPGTFRPLDLRKNEPELESALSARDLKLVVTVGSRAANAVAARHPAVPVIATMVLHDQREDGSAKVELEIPLSAQLEAMRTLFPGRSRVGLIRNPARSRSSAAALDSEARKLGFSAVVLDCDGPAGLLKAVTQSRGKVEFLLCFPDPELYNPVTIKPFVMASFEARLPIVGFSPAFVRAGAAAGIYPDYRDIGRQTGELVLKKLRGESCGNESPRSIRLAVNQRVARLLGAEFRVDAPGVEVFR